MDRRRILLLSAFILIWLAIAGVLAWLSAGTVSNPELPRFLLLYGLASAAIGFASGWAAWRLTRQEKHSRYGAFIGYLLGALPAIQLANLAGSFCAWMVAASTTLVFVPSIVFVVTYAVTALAVLFVTAAAGIFASPLLRRLPPCRWLGKAIAAIAATPRRRLVRTGALLIVLLGLLIYHRDALEFRLIEYFPDQHQESAWIGSEKKLFSSVVKQGRYDVLVVPFQADGPSVDRIARALMTREISHQIATRTSLTVPDPTWVARAFGTGARKIPDTEIHSLAEAIGARIIIVGRVSRSTKDDRLVIKLDVRSWSESSDAYQTAADMRWDNLVFRDDHPPSVAFKAVVGELLTKLPLGELKTPRSPVSIASLDAIPADSSVFTRKSENPLVNALSLQVCAMLHEQGTVEAEQLWERSLVALSQVSADSAHRRLLEARAYFHLHRRPYAVALLASPAAPEERAFYEILNGNLPASEAYAGQIEHPVLHLLAVLEVEDLRIAYNKTAGYENRRKEMNTGYPELAELMRLRLSAPDWFNPEIQRIVYGMLNAQNVRVNDRFGDYLRIGSRFLAWLYFLDDGRASISYFASDIERTRDGVWHNNAAKWKTVASDDRLAKWDYFDLLYSLNRSAAAKEVESVVTRQALPEHGLDHIAALDPVFAGHPRFEYLRARAMYDIARRNPARHMALNVHAQRLARDVHRWEGGETPISAAAEWLIHIVEFANYDDEPLRPYRTSHARGELIFHKTRVSEHEIAKRVAVSKRQLTYEQTSFAKLRELHKDLLALGLTDEAAHVLRENENRFGGSSERKTYLAKLLERDAMPEQVIGFLQKAIETDPQSWNNYYRLAQLLCEQRRYEEAQKRLLSFPGFRDKRANMVELSHRAYNAGELLYSFGEARLAAPLFQRAMGYETGSGSEMRGAEMLAFMRGDLAGATKHAIQQLNHYNSFQAGNSYVTYLFLMGQSAKAWEQFKVLEPKHGDPRIWTAALVGHRLSRTSDDGLASWVVDASFFDSRKNYLSRALRERFAFMAFTTDRHVSDRTVTLVEHVAKHYNNSGFYTNLARAYVAFKNDDFKSAAAALRPINDDLTGISASKKMPENYILPYLTISYIKTDNRKEAELLVNYHRRVAGEDFDYLISRAVLEAVDSRHASAQELLNTAFHRQPATGPRAFFPLYELLEVCEFLHRESGQDGYSRLAVEIAHRQQRSYPFSWAYAVEAKYSSEPEKRKRALAMALFLDPRSERIQQVSREEKAAAEEYLRLHPPFSVTAEG